MVLPSQGFGLGWSNAPETIAKMTNQEYVQKIKETFERYLEIVERKNADYSGTEDAFKAFRTAEIAGITKEQAVLVRIGDKFSRVANLLKLPYPTPRINESLSDTLMDLANYAIILKVMIEDESGKMEG